MNLAVAFTEYQLLQIQAIIKHYKLNNVYLLIFENDRISNLLIDYEIYDKVILMPKINITRRKRLSKSFIDKYSIFILDKFSKFDVSNVDILIGGQDENTIFSLIKKISNCTFYWNIEDGFANYYIRNFTFKAGILCKKILFKYFYGYNLPIAYGHGQCYSDKSFRMAPEISNGNKDHVSINIILKDYLILLADKIRNELKLEKYKNYRTLVVTNISNLKASNENPSNDGLLYKFHPRDKVAEDLNVTYINDKLPIEIIPFLLEDIEYIRFDVMSSSILNLKMMGLYGCVVINFKPDNSDERNVLQYVEMNNN